VVAAIATVLSAPWWQPAAIYIAVASLVLTVLGWPLSRIGLVANVAILLLLAFWRGWISAGHKSGLDPVQLTHVGY
jgi:hypothetical protein